jgi:lysophospholipase L1-like esterase
VTSQRLARAAGVLAVLAGSSAVIGSPPVAVAARRHTTSAAPPEVHSTASLVSHQVDVIGDSVFAGIASAISQSELTDSPARLWQISAESGYGWGASPGYWALGTVQGSWAIGLARADLPQHPAALVVELGVNDALRGAFADATSNPALAGRIHQGVTNNLGQLLSQVSTRIPCTILVTAPTYPTGLFGMRSVYSTEAKLINGILTAQVGPSGRSHVLLADWATLSAGHHGGAGAANTWFAGGDEIHPNPAGQVALTDLVQRVVGDCPA